MYYKICEVLKELNLDIHTGVITTPRGGNGTLDGNGYIVFKKNKTKFQLHQVLAVIHFGKDCIGMTVNHINGIKTDNTIDNLELMSVSDNVKHEHSTGLARYSKNEELRKPIRQKDSYGNIIAEFESISEAMRSTGISTGCISNACKRKRVSKGFIWELI